MLKRFYEEYERTQDVHRAIVDAMRQVGPVMLAAGLVAALSFCSLATFDLASIRTFGAPHRRSASRPRLVIELFGIPADARDAAAACAHASASSKPQAIRASTRFCEAAAGSPSDRAHASSSG